MGGRRIKIDVVFSGGGVKAYAFIGALKSIEENNLQIERVAGTSAGAIMAALIAAKFRAEEISTVFNDINLRRFLDPPKLTKLLPISKWLFLYYRMGLNRGKHLEKWLYDQLAAKGIYTFGDLEPNYLKVIVSDLSLGKLVVLPDDLNELYDLDPNNFLVSTAIRMSASFPYFFIPNRIKGRKNQESIIVDGGLLSNFPLWVFGQEPNGKAKRPVLGIKLTRANEVNNVQEINNSLDMLQVLVSTMKEAHDDRYLSKKEENNVIFIPLDCVDPVDFDIGNRTKESLIAIGKDHANAFFNYWPN